MLQTENMSICVEDFLHSTGLTLPVDVKVVKGLESKQHDGNILLAGRQIRILLSLDEPVFRCRTEHDERPFFIPLSCPNQLEPLPPDPSLDDQTYSTAADIFQAPIRPPRVRVQTGYDGGITASTVDKDDVLVNIREGSDKRGNRVLIANGISDFRRPERRRDVVLSLDTEGNFTTTTGLEEWCLAIELAKKWIRVPQRVRIHSVSGRERPCKARVVKLEKRAVAVCVDLKSGRYLLVPATPGIHIRVLNEYGHADCSSRDLHKWINISALPRVEPSVLEDHTDEDETPSSHQLAVLFPPTRNGGQPYADSLCDYQTFLAAVMTGTSCRPIKRTEALPSDNLVLRHQNICSDVSRLRLLTEDHAVVEDSDYEHPDKKPLRCYKSLVFSHPGKTYELDGNHYARPTTSNRKHDNVTENYTEVTLRGDCRGYSEIGRPFKLLNIRSKLAEVKQDNLTTQKKIKSKKDKLDLLAKPCEFIKELISTLSCQETLVLLDEIGLGMYKDLFVEEIVEGFVLVGCDLDYLIDIGMRRVHACKLRAVLQGRLIRTAFWEDLLLLRHK